MRTEQHRSRRTGMTDAEPSVAPVPPVRPWQRLVGALIVVVASLPAMYVLMLGLALGAGATLGGFGEGPRSPDAPWFDAVAALFVASWLAACVVGVALGRRRLRWAFAPWAVIAAQTAVALAVSRWA